MSEKLTTKGIEVEQFVGSKKTGEILALSPLIKKNLSKFMTEPDARNIEYATEPSVDYTGLLYELLYNRMLLRDFLHSVSKKSLRNFPEIHDNNKEYLASLPDDDAYTIIPGSCISHKFDQDFKFSDPNNPYYQIIRDRYQTSIVTTSLHINLGAPDSLSAIKLSNAMRLIASQVLAITASSPFHNGKITGYQSYRWHSFPRTPQEVPIFKDLEHFIKWNEEKIQDKEMFNVRHLWTSVRPNGPTRPHVLNRVELRIPDFMFDCCQILALTSYLEMRFLDFLENGIPKILESDEYDLATISDKNEDNVAKDGLQAKIFDFLTESEMTIGEQIERDYKKFSVKANSMGITEVYKKLEQVMQNGNAASCMLSEFELRQKADSSLSDDQVIRDILASAATKQEEIDKEIFNRGKLTGNCS